MALAHVSESDEDEYHSMCGHEPEDAEDEEAESNMEPPVHPVPSMQGAFEESILESTIDDETIKPSAGQDAETRRRQLLDQKHYDDSWTTRWKQRTGAQHHPLFKLMAQIVFGMHLLQQGQAKSNEEVVKILQTHVNEVDTFLERTAEDFGLAIADIDERVRHLKLPMEHLEVFKAMLDDKKFRMQLLDGNDKIERIIDRTAKAMNAALTDVQKGTQATHELGKYLDSIRDVWPKKNNGIADVFGAMRGNEQGWLKYLKDLQAKGQTLGNKLVQLGTVIGEMSKLAAAASRRNRPTSRQLSPSGVAKSAPNSPGLRSKFAQSDAPPPMPMQRERSMSLNKPLPREPDAASGAARMTMSKAHPVPFAQRYEQPRQSPQSPAPSARRISTMPDGSPACPKTAGAPRDARTTSTRTSDLAELLRHSGPLRSNPPDHDLSAGDRETSGDRKPARSRSQGANDILNAVAGAEQPPVGRSKSQGAAMIVHGPRSESRDSKSGRPRSRGADKALSTVPESTSRKDSVASTGFARRISRRMKHIPPIEDVKTTERPSTAKTTATAPTDSAYSSGTDKKQAPPPAYSSDPEKKPPPSRAGTVKTDSARPPSRLGLFPRSTEPLTPSAASNLSYGERQEYENGGILPSSSSVTSPASTKTSTHKSQTLSLRNFFHRRQKSSMVM